MREKIIEHGQQPKPGHERSRSRAMGEGRKKGSNQVIWRMSSWWREAHELEVESRGVGEKS